MISGAEEVGPAWFLCALLCVRVIYHAASRLCRHNLYYLGALAALCFVLAYVLEGRAGLPLRLVQSLSAFLFFYAGDLCKNLCASVRKWSERTGGAFACAAGAAVLFAVVIWMAAVSGEPLLLVGNSLPDSWIVTVIGGGAGCLGLALLAMAAARIRGLSGMLAYFGVHSMAVMGLHSEIRVVLHLMLEKLLRVPDWCLEPLTFMLTFAACLPAVWVIRRYIPLLAGRKRQC